MPADHAVLVARLLKEAHDLDAAYRAPEDGPSSTAQLLLDAAAALAAPPEAAPTVGVMACGICPECGPVSEVDAERCCTGCGHDVAMFDRPTLVRTADLRHVAACHEATSTPDCRAAVRAALQEVAALVDTPPRET